MVQQVAAWRHLKQRGGLLLEYIVHESDLFLYFFGDVERIYTETHLWEKVRHTTDKPLSGNLARFYGHRVKEDLDKSETVECTSEDMTLAVMRFRSGAMGQLTFSMAAPGEPTHVGVVYCGDGSIKLPGSRSGNPVRLTKIGAQEPVAIEEVLDLVPNFHLDETTSRFFNGQKRLSSYKLTFEEIDRKLIAVELQDFADAVMTGGQPEVTGGVGLKAVALTYAFLESGLVNKPVSLKDVAEDKVNAYQREINESIGL
jgi:predicted dehydrogenase